MAYPQKRINKANHSHNLHIQKVIYKGILTARYTDGMESKNEELETATFGAGCFWNVEETYRHLEGVKETAVGFMGGHVESPTYENVCTDKTGHAEVTQIKYNPDEVSYENLLKVFWENHDPTTLDRQGPDVGSQYRSVIFFHKPEQEKLARESKKKMDKSNKFNEHIVTEISPATDFYKAEEYHQKYVQKMGLGTH